eukprot:5555043-Prymnesium_polylepis.2
MRQCEEVHPQAAWVRVVMVGRPDSQRLASRAEGVDATSNSGVPGPVGGRARRVRHPGVELIVPRRDLGHIEVLTDRDQTVWLRPVAADLPQAVPSEREDHDGSARRVRDEQLASHGRHVPGAQEDVRAELAPELQRVGLQRDDRVIPLTGLEVRDREQSTAIGSEQQRLDHGALVVCNSAGRSTKTAGDIRWRVAT